MLVLIRILNLRTPRTGYRLVQDYFKLSDSIAVKQLRCLCLTATLVRLR